MTHFRVAKRYAKGYMDFLTDSGKEEILMEEMLQLRDLIQSSRELKNFFASPVIDFKRKTQIMENVLEAFSIETKTFLSLIIKQGRSEAIGAIAHEFVQLYKTKNGIKDVKITSAQELQEHQIEAILSKAKEFLPENTKFEVVSKVNPELIGGFILRLDDKQYDASLKTKMNNIKKEFDLKHYIPKI